MGGTVGTFLELQRCGCNSLPVIYIASRLGTKRAMVRITLRALGNWRYHEQEMFRLADETNEPIYVETTNPRVMLLYKKSGYVEYANLKHPYEDLTIWFMKRGAGIIKNN